MVLLSNTTSLDGRNIITFRRDFGGYITKEENPLLPLELEKGDVYFECKVSKGEYTSNPRILIL